MTEARRQSALGPDLLDTMRLYVGTLTSRYGHDPICAAALYDDEAFRGEESMRNLG